MIYYKSQEDEEEKKQCKYLHILFQIYNYLIEKKQLI